MMIRRNRFNIYLVLCAIVAFSAGCKTEEGNRKKQLSTLQLHEEANPDVTGRTEAVQVYREHPVTFTVTKVPFLAESHIKEAKVVEVVGGFALRIDFDKEGEMLLEQYTSAGRGRHIAVFSQWEETAELKVNAGRWLAAPLIKTHITDGVFIFTPDASREEVDKIVLGLNNVAKKLDTGKGIQ
jgi:hypothetical protein